MPPKVHEASAIMCSSASMSGQAMNAENSSSVVLSVWSFGSPHAEPSEYCVALEARRFAQHHSGQALGTQSPNMARRTATQPYYFLQRQER
jgi:hypothetical protein